jgi:hypothetical protein
MSDTVVEDSAANTRVQSRRNVVKQVDVSIGIDCTGKSEMGSLSTVSM